MLTLDLARRLAAAGVLWEPRPGDRFAIDVEALADDIYWISDLTIELHHYADKSVLGFNGTTEWALDSIELDQTVWLPREDQLRELLGDRLRSVHHEPAADEGTVWRVVTSDGQQERTTQDDDLECAYARALLDLC
ncbi:pilus assembly protein CpaE [Mariniluteicoccus flavus]